MEKEILDEIKELKDVISQLVGTRDLPDGEKFSYEALDKAAKQFQKLSIERGEWVEDSHIDKIIKDAPYRAGAFIRKEFGFSNFFKRGQTYYYNKKDLIALGKELKNRNVNLKRYIEYIEDQVKFNKSLQDAKNNKKGKRKAFYLPSDLKDITTSPPKAPSPEVIREHIKQLKEEFFEYKLNEYIDIYRGNYAMMKAMYIFEKYIEPEIRKRCKRWCENFNYANHALLEITNKKEVFVPVKDDDMIEL